MTVMTAERRPALILLGGGLLVVSVLGTIHLESSASRFGLAAGVLLAATAIVVALARCRDELRIEIDDVRIEVRTSYIGGFSPQRTDFALSDIEWTAIRTEPSHRVLVVRSEGANAIFPIDTGALGGEINPADLETLLHRYGVPVQRTAIQGASGRVRRYLVRRSTAGLIALIGWILLISFFLLDLVWTRPAVGWMPVFLVFNNAIFAASFWWNGIALAVDDEGVTVPERIWPRLPIYRERRFALDELRDAVLTPDAIRFATVEGTVEIPRPRRAEAFLADVDNRLGNESRDAIANPRAPVRGRPL